MASPDTPWLSHTLVGDGAHRFGALVIGLPGHRAILASPSGIPC